MTLNATGGIPLMTSDELEELKWVDGEWKFVKSDYWAKVEWFATFDERPVRTGITPFQVQRGGLIFRAPAIFTRPTRRDIIAARKKKARDHRLHWFRDWKRARSLRRYLRDELDDWDDDE